MAWNESTGTRHVRRAILARAPRKALYEHARVLRIRGRSRMNKGELADAVLERVDAAENYPEGLIRPHG